MKKFILGALVGIVVLLCCSFSYTEGSSNVHVNIRTIEGHKYIIAHSEYTGGAARPGGVAIIHSESCSCKSTKK